MPVENVITANPLSAEALRAGIPGATQPGMANGWFNNMFGALRRIFPSGPLAGEYGVKSSQPVLSPFQANPVEEPHPTMRPGQTTAALGGSGTPIYAGFVTDLGEYNGKLQGINAFPIYEQMRRSDPDVRAALLATKLPIRCAQYEVVPGVTAASPLHSFAVEIADFVRENLFGGLESMTSTGFMHSQSFESVLENALLNLDFGCSSHEILWTIDQNHVRIRKLAPRLPMTFYRFYPDTDGETLLAMEQYGYRGSDYVNVIIPAEKLDFFNYDKEGADFYGRALALDTPIPTPAGWKKMGELCIGDKVFDDTGRPCNVVAVSPVWKNRPCFRISFNTGVPIVADAAHEWMTQSFQERRRYKVPCLRSTEDLSKHIRYYGGRFRNYSVEKCGTLQYPKKNLPVDPYAVGLWLGDGKGAQVSVTGLFPHLNRLGLNRNKHIPEIYLHSSSDQRKAILAGLMDSDGSVNPRGGECVFVNGNEALIDGVIEILRSLGETPTKTKVDAPRENTNDYWIVNFYPLSSPFRLQRKTAILNAALGRRKKRNHSKHYIDSIVPVDPQDTICIEVDSPSHLFLAGTSCVPTHNSALRAAYASWYIKSNLYRLDCIAIERNGMGIPVITLAENADDDDKAYAQRFVTMVATHEQTGLTLPFGHDFKLAGMTGRIRDPKTSIQAHSEQILRSFLAQFIAFGTTATGSRSLSSDMITFFKLGLNAIARGMTTTMSNSSIRRLVDFNYGDSRKQIPYPRLRHSNIAALDPMELAEKIKNLAQWQVDLIQPDDELENWFRHDYGMPPKSEPRLRNMPLQQRIMESPQPGVTPLEIEVGKNPGGPKPVVEPIHPTQGDNPPHPGTPAKQNYDPGVEPNPNRGKPGKVDPVASGNVKATDTVDVLMLLADKQPSVPKRITFDFDGTISIASDPEQVDFQPGKFGKLSQSAKLLMEKLKAAGFTIAVVTARTDIAETKAQIKKWGLPVDSVGNTKLPCIASIDDRGLHIAWGAELDEAAVSRVLKALKKISRDHGDK